MYMCVFACTCVYEYIYKPTDDIVCVATLVHTVTVVEQNNVHFEEVQDTCLPKTLHELSSSPMTEFLLAVSVTTSCTFNSAVSLPGSSHLSTC